VLVVAVHPDDETLGCGGTLLRYKAEGHRLHWLVLTGDAGFIQDEALLARRHRQVERVRERYGFDGCHFLDHPSTQLDRVGHDILIRSISTVFTQVQPTIVFLPYRQDVHSDHRIAFETAFACTKSFRYPSIEKVYMMEVLSETEFSADPGGFLPNVFFDISAHLDKKIEILKEYETEMGQHPFPRSERNLRALATFRGAMAGVDSAEAFMLIREFVR